MKKSIILLLLLFSVIPVFSQIDRTESLLTDLVYNEADPLLLPEKSVRYNFIYVGANYSSNSFYAGREIGADMANISGHLFFYSYTGLFVGASGSWFDQLTPGYSNTTLTAGFSKSLDPNKRFNFRTSYSRFLFNKTDADSYYPYQNNFNLGLSFRKNWIGARINGNLLFGDEYRINNSVALFSRLTLLKLGKYDKLYTAPEVSAFFSTETVSTTNNSQTTDPTTTDWSEIYSLLNTQLSVPLGLSLGNFDVELSYSMNFPTTQDVNISYPSSSFYSVSIGYMLPIVKK